MMNFTNVLGVFKQERTAPSHMRNLVEMAAADGQFLDSEKELLKTIAKRNGISESQLSEIQKNPGSVKFEAPKDEKQKFNQLYDLVQMMGIDNHVHQKEQEFASFLAVQLGYRKEVARELVDVISQNIRNGVAPDEAMKRVHMMIS